MKTALIRHLDIYYEMKIFVVHMNWTTKNMIKSVYRWSSLSVCVCARVRLWYTFGMEVGVRYVFVCAKRWESIEIQISHKLRALAASLVRFIADNQQIYKRMCVFFHFICKSAAHSISYKNTTTHMYWSKNDRLKIIGPAHTNGSALYHQFIFVTARVEILFCYVFFFNSKALLLHMWVNIYRIRSLLQFLSLLYLCSLRKIHFSTSHFQSVSMAFSWNLNVVDARTFVTTKQKQTTHRAVFSLYHLFILLRSQLYLFYIIYLFVSNEQEFIQSSHSCFVIRFGFLFSFFLMNSVSHRCSFSFWLHFSATIFVWRLNFQNVLIFFIVIVFVFFLVNFGNPLDSIPRKNVFNISWIVCVLRADRSM